MRQSRYTTQQIALSGGQLILPHTGSTDLDMSLLDNLNQENEAERRQEMAAA